MTPHQLRIKRVYKPPDDRDGVRVLVDRLWPRGLSREKARIDLWLKEGNCAERRAPPPLSRRSRGLGRLQDRLLRRTRTGAGAVGGSRPLLERLTREPVTLLFAARDETRNNAVALKEWIDSQNLHGRRSQR